MSLRAYSIMDSAVGFGPIDPGSNPGGPVLFFIPEGFAHGFLVLSKTVDFQYKVTNFYSKESEGGVIWNDSDIGVKWPIKKGIALSEKDKSWPYFIEIKSQLKKIWGK